MRRITIFVGLKIVEIGVSLVVLYGLMYTSFVIISYDDPFIAGSEFWSASGMMAAFMGILIVTAILLGAILLSVAIAVFVRWNWRKAGEINRRWERRQHDRHEGA